MNMNMVQGHNHENRTQFLQLMNMNMVNFLAQSYMLKIQKHMHALIPLFCSVPNM